MYTAPTDQALRSDIEVLKKLGFNMMRKHVKVEPARFYYWCDRLGLMGLAGHAERHNRRSSDDRFESAQGQPPHG